MILKLFTQPTCGKCPAAEALLNQFKIHPAKGGTKFKIGEYDITTVDGLAEASFYSVMATPTILLCNDSGKVIKDWRGEVPSLAEITKLLK
jgi:thioredoxin-related protein